MPRSRRLNRGRYHRRALGGGERSSLRLARSLACETSACRIGLVGSAYCRIDDPKRTLESPKQALRVPSQLGLATILCTLIAFEVPTSRFPAALRSSTAKACDGRAGF